MGPGTRRKVDAAASTRDAIVSASLSLFARDGFDSTSTDAIAKAAGVTKGALYWHFENKEELFQAILDEIRKEWRAQVLQRVDQVDEPTGKLDQLFKNYCTLLGDRPEICLFLQRASMDKDERRSKRVRTVYKQTARYIARIFEEGKRIGVFRVDLRSELMGHAVLAALTGAELQCLVDDRLSFRDLVNEIRKRVLKGVLKNPD